MGDSSRRLIAGLSLATIGLSLVACSDDGNDVASNGATVATTTSATSAPERSTTTAAAAVIAADGLGVARFGQEADAALAAMESRFGEATDLGATSCAPRITQQWDWGDGLSAYFAETFVGYRYLLGAGGPPLRTEAGVGEGATVAQLKAAYPDRVTFTPDSDEGGSVFTVELPAGSLTGYAAGPGDTDRIVSFTVGEDCGE